MKIAFCLCLSVLSLNVLAAMWEPNEKDLQGLLNKSRKTPEMQLKKKFQNPEKISASRIHLPGDFSYFSAYQKLTQLYPGPAKNFAF